MSTRGERVDARARSAVPVLLALLAAPVVLAALAGCAATSLDRGVPRLRDAACVPADLGTMHNVSKIGTVWIGSYPEPSDLDLAARRGIASAIDLATPSEKPAWDVAATCERYGIEYVPVGIDSRDRITDEDVDRALGALRDRARRAVLLFCAHGDRAAMFLAIHRATDDGLDVETALVEARRAGMKPGHPEVFVRKQVERLAQSRSQRAVPASSDIVAATVRH